MSPYVLPTVHFNTDAYRKFDYTWHLNSSCSLRDQKIFPRDSNVSVDRRQLVAPANHQENMAGTPDTHRVILVPLLAKDQLTVKTPLSSDANFLKTLGLTSART